MRPFPRERASGGVGFAIAAIESMTLGNGVRPYSYPGATVPYTGTELCGLPRGGTVSAMLSQGSIFGCCLKSVNQEQPPIARMRTARRVVGDWWLVAGRKATRCRRVLPATNHQPPISQLALTPHLPRTVAAQHVHRLVGAIGGRLDPDAVVPGAETRVV